MTALSTHALLADYRSGRRRPREVLESVYACIEKTGKAPVWIAVVPFERALTALETAERDHADGALLGVPFAVKDNIDVAGLPTTAACPEFAYTPAQSAPVVEQLLAAGAIVVGKTNLDQFATGLVGTRSPYGICASVFDARYIAGGSSSGSALAVARGQASFALGTDTAGSGRVPAAFNGLVGLKPTRGLLSTRGVVPACRSLDCVSILAHGVRDAELVLACAASYDAADPYSRRSPGCTLSASGLCIGVPEAAGLEFFGDEESARLFAVAVERWDALGAELVSIDLGPFREAGDLLYGGPWIAERLSALDPFLRKHPDAVHPVVREILNSARTIDAAEAFRGQHRLAELRRQVEPALDSIDALLVPTVPKHFTIDEVLTEPLLYNRQLGTYTNFVNLLDLAALALPAGSRKNGLPFGVTLVAPAFRDARLIELGRRFLGEAAPSSATAPKPRSVWLAVAGAHLTGQPLNAELTRRGARLVRSARTSSEYRLYALETVPRKPGLVYTPGGAGHAIEVEVWELDEPAFGSFVAGVPAPMTIGMTKLEDGSWVKGFSCEPHALTGAREISQHGGWRAFLASLGS